MNRLRILVIIGAIFMSLFGVGRVHAMPLNAVEMASEACSSHHGCDSAPLDCVDHCISGVVNESISLLVLGAAVVLVLAAFAIIAEGTPVALGFSPITSNRPPPNRLWVKSTAKRE